MYQRLFSLQRSRPITLYSRTFTSMLLRFNVCAITAYVIIIATRTPLLDWIDRYLQVAIAQLCVAKAHLSAPPLGFRTGRIQMLPLLARHCQGCRIRSGVLRSC